MKDEQVPGKRGRKPLPESERKQGQYIFLAPDVRIWLEAQCRPGDTIGRVIERLVRANAEDPDAAYDAMRDTQDAIAHPVVDDGAEVPAF